MTETWLPIQGYEGEYEVSDAGRVKSLARVVSSYGGRQRITSELIRKFFVNNRGRTMVALRGARAPDHHQIHHLVLEAFVGPKPLGMYGCHRDDDPTNNRLDNLYWGTPADNTADCLRNGTHNMASKTSCLRGHEFTDANTKVTVRKNGRTKRECRLCLELHNANRRKARLKV